MEHWKVEAVHFERESIDQEVQSHTVPCQAVVFEPSPSIAQDAGDAGALRVIGCPAAALSGLPWIPTRMRFKAQRYMEERLFEIGPLESDGADLLARLPASGHDIDTNASDGHVAGFPSTDAHSHT